MINHVMYFGLKILLFHFKQLFFRTLCFSALVYSDNNTTTSHPSPFPIPCFLSVLPHLSLYYNCAISSQSIEISLYSNPFISHYKYWTFQTIFLRQAYLISYHSMHGYHNTLLGQKLLLVKKKISSRTTFLSKLDITVDSNLIFHKNLLKIFNKMVGRLIVPSTTP